MVNLGRKAALEPGPPHAVEGLGLKDRKHAALKCAGTARHGLNLLLIAAGPKATWRVRALATWPCVGSRFYHLQGQPLVYFSHLPPGFREIVRISRCTSHHPFV